LHDRLEFQHERLHSYLENQHSRYHDRYDDY
jgi:hypothetical protein